MISEDMKRKIDLFLEDLRVVVAGGRVTGDFSDVYDRHPDIRIGIRRAMLYLQKQEAK